MSLNLLWLAVASCSTVALAGTAAAGENRTLSKETTTASHSAQLNATTVSTTLGASCTAPVDADCFSCIASNCAFSYLESSSVCTTECRSSACYASRDFKSDNRFHPVGGACPAAVAAEVTKGSTIISDGNKNSGSDSNIKYSDSYAVVGGTIFGLLALVISILLFAYLRIRGRDCTGSREMLSPDEEDSLSARLLFDGRESTDVPLLTDIDNDCELDLSHIPSSNQSGVLEGTNRLWAPFAAPELSPSPSALPDSENEHDDAGAAWRVASRKLDRPSSVIRPPSVTGTVLAPIEDLPF